jgi:ATP-dependent DNA helicase DinG
VAADVDAILGPGGALGRALPGWESRPQQLAMARAVAAALDDGGPLIVEAGTGTGKTLAYLVPAILSGKKVVVSTASRNLQEQISGNDIPLLASLFDRRLTAVVLKGVSNYVCLRRYAEEGWIDDPHLTTISEWLSRTAGGDRAELAAVPEDAPAWRAVTTTSDARLGPRCPFFERCFVTRARRAALKADVTIVNHHLYFADAALRADAGSAILPPHDAVIFDEAHALEDVATEHFGVAVSTLRVTALLRDAERALGETVDDVAHGAADLFNALRRRVDRGGPLFGGAGRLLAPEDLFTAERRELWFRLDAALEELAMRAARRGEAEEDEALAAVARRADALRADLATVAEGHGASARHVRWVEVIGRQLHLHASPVEIGGLFRGMVVDRVPAVVLTSATLSAGGSFEYTRARLGLDERAGELALPSPFDYPSQAILYLPRDLPLPDDPGFLDALVARMVDLCALTRGRALLLFTSWRALRHAAAALRAREGFPWPILVQGEAPKTALLEALRRDVGSVLLATGSFWEGVDVPGEALSLVVIDKLPFQPPDDPLAAARAERLAERGVDPFTAHQLPRAAIALKQAFGRLIRRRDDRGIVAILDARIVARNYGRELIATLPPAARTSAFEQVRRFWERAADRGTPVRVA